MRMFSSYYTNRGKVRSNNEDAILVNDLLICEKDLEKCEVVELETGRSLLIVVDGMGGHERGEVASKIVLETFKEQKENIFNVEDVKAAVKLARDRLEEYVRVNPSAHGLGCALAGMMILENEEAIVFNVGDCRVYRFVNDNLRRLTKDHSLVELLLSEGMITPREAREHPQRNVLTSAVVGDGYASSMEIYVNKVDIGLGGKFLICSDGLWNELVDEEIVEAMRENDSCATLLKRLVEKTLKDNVSFILLELREGSAA